MKFHKLSQNYFENINIILKEITIKMQNNRLSKNITLELVDKNHIDFIELREKILNCEENFYNYKSDFDKDTIHMVSINIENKIIGFITFEDINDFSEESKEVVNLISIYINKEFRQKHITTKIIMVLVLHNFQKNIAMVVADPNINMSVVIMNIVMNLLEMVSYGGIDFGDEKSKFLDYLAMFGLMIKINYFNYERFNSGNCRLVFDDNEYNQFNLERAITNEDTLNIGIGGYLNAYQKCKNNNIPTYSTNVIYYLIKKENQ
jgi:hypothetical protein